jgi:hypothetical protein
LSYKENYNINATNRNKGELTMFAVLTAMNLGPNMRSVSEKAADQASKYIKYMKGFKGATFFGDIEAGEYYTLVLWQSKEDSEAANSFVGPKLGGIVGDFLKSPPTRKIFEVYEPKI